MINLEWLLRRDMMNLEFIVVQIHLIVSDYSLKFYVFKLPKLPYIVVGLLTLNLRILK